LVEIRVWLLLGLRLKQDLKRRRGQSLKRWPMWLPARLLMRFFGQAHQQVTVQAIARVRRQRFRLQLQLWLRFCARRRLRGFVNV